MVRKNSAKRKNSYINRLRQREKVRSKQYAGWRKQFESSYMSRLRSRKSSRGKNQNGGFTIKSSLTKMKKGFINLKNDIVLLFTSKKSLEKKYKDDPDKVIELIKRKTKIRNRALIIAAIVAVLAGSAAFYKKKRSDAAKKKVEEIEEKIAEGKVVVKNLSQKKDKINASSPRSKKNKVKKRKEIQVVNQKLKRQEKENKRLERAKKETEERNKRNLNPQYQKNKKSCAGKGESECVGPCKKKFSSGRGGRKKKYQRCIPRA